MPVASQRLAREIVSQGVVTIVLVHAGKEKGLVTRPRCCSFLGGPCRALDPSAGIRHDALGTRHKSFPMPRPYGTWPIHIRQQFIGQIDLHAAILKERLLPAFDTINAEAERVEKETFDRLMSRSSSEDPDIASMQETAVDEASDFLLMMERMKQAQINLQTVGLSHLVEQQLLELHRLRFVPVEDDRTVELKIELTKAELAKDGIRVETIKAWQKVQELRLVANCAKHGEGRACQELRKLRPDLLTPPYRATDGLPWPDPDPVVLNPLGGVNLYVSLKEFEEYVASAKSFWSDLAAALPI